MKGKLCQVIAVVKGKKSFHEKRLTELHRATEKVDLTLGRSRTYQPKDENGDRLPHEKQNVQINIREALVETKGLFKQICGSVATLDVGNTVAKANVVVEDKVLAKDVPATHLLFLEHKLEELGKFFGSLVALDPSHKWTYDPNGDVYKSEPTETIRTKKTLVPIVMSPATDKFPAQVKESMEEVPIGVYTDIKFSGAIPAVKKREALERIRILKEAVKSAREMANTIEVEDVDLDSSLLNYIFDPAIANEK